MIFLVMVFAAVAATAQETPVVSERDDSAQAQQETHEQQGAEDVAEGVPENLHPDRGVVRRLSRKIFQ